MDDCCQQDCCCCIGCDEDDDEISYYNDNIEPCEYDDYETNTTEEAPEVDDETVKDDDRVIDLPIHFHILQYEFTIEGKQFSIKSSCEDFGSITKEINAIWRPANIKFTSKCSDHGLLEEVDQESKLIEVIEQAKPGSQVARKSALEQLLNGRFPPQKGYINIYILPSIGRGLEGLSFTYPDREFEGVSVISEHEGSGEWLRLPKITNKNRQSLARVIAHELGHVFNLIHYDGCPGCLMAPRDGIRGYNLQTSHIQRARRFAKKIEEIIQKK